jgi:phage/plasmid-like protein (TIGR03299 family)
MGFITEINSLEEIDAFKVEKTPVFFNDNVRVPDTFSLRRVDDGHHLGIVGKNYRPIQMDEMIDVLDKASNRVGDIEHVGYTTSRGGRKVLIQSKLAENINIEGDVIEPYFYTVIDNTGMGSNKTCPSTKRISCDNAFHLIREESTALNSRHASNFDDRVNLTIDSIVGSINSARRFSETVVKLKSQRFSRDEMVKLTETLLPVAEEESTKRGHKRDKLVELYESGLGNVGETKWDALNALTEYETHTGKQSSSKLIRNLVTGSNQLSQKGLKLLAA